MVVPLNEIDTFFTLCSVDDQVVVVQDADDAEYMAGKLVVEYRKCGLEVSIRKTGKLTVGGNQLSVELKDGQVVGGLPGDQET